MRHASPQPMSGTRHARRFGFTLTELMIAVAVLIGVLLATSKIFSTTSKVTGAGRAATDVLREAAAIEKQIRADIARLSYEGVFAIRNVALRNDIYDPINNAVLLNPSASPDTIIRADQLVFFANGAQSPVTFPLGGGQNLKAQGAVSRIYYGHAYQFGDAGRPATVTQRDPLPDVVTGQDAFERVYPWSQGLISTVETQYSTDGIEGDIFSWGSPSQVNMVRRDPRQWLLVRQPVLLVDDDEDVDPATGFSTIGSNSKTFYLASNVGHPGGMVTARSIFLTDPRSPELDWTPQIFHGRVDAAATQMNELRDALQYNWGAATERPWWTTTGDGMRGLISSDLVYYPRAEREAPSANRVDQALTNSVIANACSSVRIEWTWADDTGTVRDIYGDVVDDGAGFDLHFAFDRGTVNEQPWFGLRDDDRGVAPYIDGDYAGALGYVYAETVKPFGELPNAIERQFTLAPPFGGVRVYEAFFGYNQDRPFPPFHGEDSTGFVDSDFTPWPSAIRVTLTLHDVDTTFEGGREVQFVIELPQRRPGPSR